MRYVSKLANKKKDFRKNMKRTIITTSHRGGENNNQVCRRWKENADPMSFSKQLNPNFPNTESEIVEKVYCRKSDSEKV